MRIGRFGPYPTFVHCLINAHHAPFEWSAASGGHRNRIANDGARPFLCLIPATNGDLKLGVAVARHFFALSSTDNGVWSVRFDETAPRRVRIAPGGIPCGASAPPPAPSRQR